MKTRIQLLLSAALLASAPMVFAHAKLVKSSPANGATIATAPAEMRLTFNEPIEPSFSSVTLDAPDGKPLEAAKSAVAGDDPAALSLSLPALVAGQYTARWSAMGKDGHRTKGVVTFTVK